MSGFAQRRRVLQLRREALRLRSAELRLSIAHDLQSLQAPAAVIDRGLQGLRWLRAHPALPIGAAVALAVLRPRRALRWGSRLWWGWRLWRRAAGLMERAAGPLSGAPAVRGRHGGSRR